MFAASAKTTIDREDWDMTWNMAVEAGGFLVGKKVDLVDLAPTTRLRTGNNQDRAR
jgi:hypothetical protein